MATAPPHLLLFSPTLLTSSLKSHHHTPFTRTIPTTRRNQLQLLSPKSNNKNKNNNNNSSSADIPDRLISAITYFYPFFDGIQYGKYLILQYPPFQSLIYPLIPSIRAFKSFPLNGFLVFLTLYFVVVRNRNFSRYVRFNTMQAIALDVLLIVPDVVERGWNPREGVGLDVVMSLDSTVFLFLLVCLMYGSGCCVFGMVPRLPIVADAAERQVPP